MPPATDLLEKFPDPQYSWCCDFSSLQVNSNSLGYFKCFQGSCFQKGKSNAAWCQIAFIYVLSHYNVLSHGMKRQFPPHICH